MQDIEPGYLIQILPCHVSPGDLRSGTHPSDISAVMVPPSLGHYEE